MVKSAVFAAGLVATIGLVGCSQDPADPQPSATSGDISGVQSFSDLSQDHTKDNVDYPQSPPVGGEHDPTWISCNGEVYTQPVRSENAVHSMEHGAVWVTYLPDLSSKDVQSLADRVSGEPYSFMSPYPDQSSPVVLTAWGLQLAVDDVSDERIDAFLTAYRQGPQTPEPGAACDGGVMP